VSILLGNGDGSFGAPVIYTVGVQPYGVAVGDFNRDGIPDLVVANYGSGTVSVLLGNSDGSFQDARNYAMGAFEPEAVAVGDFNGDGIPDLATANYVYASGTVSILLGNGDGSFQPARTYATGGSMPNSVAVGDFNGDGTLDLVLANYGSGTVSVLLGNGDGSFQPGHTYALGSDPFSVVVGDFNGDGTPDFAVVTGRLGQPGTVHVFLGNGDGTFRDPVNYPVDPGIGSLAIADFNEDGIPDLAVGSSSAGTVSVLLGNGDGSFQPAQRYAVGSSPFSVAVGDFNGDGFPDVAAATLEGTANVLLNAADWGGGPAPVPVTPHGPVAHSTALGAIPPAPFAAVAPSFDRRAAPVGPLPFLAPERDPALRLPATTDRFEAAPQPRSRFTGNQARDGVFKAWADPWTDRWAAEAALAHTTVASA
jgi:hypothetical protein